jgi:hypothetical protein
MTDQLAPGLALAGIATAAAVSGLRWLAIAACLAAVPFLVTGLGFAIGRQRARRSRRAGVAR